MPIKGADFFTQLCTASITVELKLQAELCQSDQMVFIIRRLSGQSRFVQVVQPQFAQWRHCGI